MVRVFDAQKIYGIVPNELGTKLLIYGGNRIKVFQSDFRDFCAVQEATSCICHDWVLSAKWINSDRNIVTVTMHNIVVLWSSEMEFVEKVVCEEQCILYAASIYGSEWSNLAVLSGTVFSDVLLWRPSKCGILQRLRGHKVNTIDTSLVTSYLIYIQGLFLK